jgi:ABC-2 type transport system ATP-binding protein
LIPTRRAFATASTYLAEWDPKASSPAPDYRVRNRAKVDDFATFFRYAKRTREVSPASAGNRRRSEARYVGAVTEFAIEARGLRKSYGDVVALAGLDLRATAGSVLGVLGPNGAGKTTAVRIMTTLLPPDEGTVEVVGLDAVRDAAALRAKIGLAGQYAAVDENLTGSENLEMVGLLYHLGRQASRRRAGELLAQFDLAEAGERVVRTYSGGMRRRLDLAAALVARPQVLFLDEPTTGLDPRSRIALWETIEECVAGGTTVLLTTQYLDEADRLADRIAVIDRGRVIAEGTPDELKSQVGGERLEVSVGDPEQAEAAARAMAEVADGSPGADGRLVSAPIRRRDGVIVEAVRRLDDAGVEVDDLTVRRPTLDDVFITLTGHAAEAVDAEGTADEEQREREYAESPR